jgi:hypothetical protein
LGSISEYRQDIAKTFNQLFSEMGYHQDILEILPKVVVAGENILPVFGATLFVATIPVAASASGAHIGQPASN